MFPPTLERYRLHFPGGPVSLHSRCNGVCLPPLLDVASLLLTQFPPKHTIAGLFSLRLLPALIWLQIYRLCTFPTRIYLLAVVVSLYRGAYGQLSVCA